MSVQLLDKTRKINKLLHNNNSTKVVFNDICKVMMETLDSNILNMLGEYYGVSRQYLSETASTQTLVDAISKYGFYKDTNKEDWIGIPLWVHRRCKYPMFDISNKIYLNDSFELKYNNDGIIQSFHFMIYDNNKNTYLVSYQKNNENKVVVHLNNYLDMDFDDKYDFQPLLDALKVIPYKESFIKNQELYHILYFGQRDWGYNNTGIRYIDKTGHMITPLQTRQIIGYTISIEPIMSGTTNPYRYIYVNDIEKIPETSPQQNTPPLSEVPQDSGSLSSKIMNITYELYVSDAAAGSRFYSLKKIDENGTTVINKNPFLDNIGVANGIHFFNQKLGFISITNASNDHCEVYRTQDGGLTFKQIKLKNTGDYDYLQIPYEDNGHYIMKVSKGSQSDSDTDYIIYRSKDLGQTWTKQ